LIVHFENPRIGGSIPPLATIFSQQPALKIPNKCIRPKWHLLKMK